MPIIPLQLARVSNLLRTNVANGNIARTQRQILAAQNELSTGQRINVASDDPGDAAIVQQLRKTLEAREAYADNLDRAVSHLSQVDATLADVNDLLLQAQTIASANVSDTVTDGERAGAAEIIKSLYSQMLSLSNKEHEGMYLFGGDKSTQPPFVEESGGIRFVGSRNLLQNAFDEGTQLSFMVDGAQIFGALSTRVTGTADLRPATGESITLLTPLSNLRGGTGIDLSGLSIANGTSTATISLASLPADATVEDLLNAVNGSGTGVLAQINETGTGINILNPVQGSLMTINENGGLTMEQLGLGGAETTPVAPQGIFSNLAALRDGLLQGDQAKITAAAEGLQADYDRVVRARGQTGARVQELESRRDRLEDQNLATTSLLSTLQDSDYTQAVTRYLSLQDALQASLMTGARTLQLSLLDFLG